MKMITKTIVNELTYKIIGAAIEVHKQLGPGLLEKVYEAALAHELQLRGLRINRQQTIPVFYKGVELDCQLRYDILVEDLIICEIKAVVDMHPIFDATLISYLKHLKKPKGILINFHRTNLFREGQKTFVNHYFSDLPE